MFDYIYIDNVAGIDTPVKLEFIGTPRKKEKQNTVSKIENGVYINKLTGIIGGNASGKTSIIRAICAIGTFLSYSDDKHKNDKISLKTNKEGFEVKDSLFDILPSQNNKHKDKMSNIKVEMYIENGEEPGYYIYDLKYYLGNDLETRVIENLYYRKRFKDTPQSIVSIKKEKLESEIGYKYNHKESLAADYRDVDDNLYKQFNQKMRYYTTFYEHYVKYSQTSRDFFLIDPIQYINLHFWLQQDEEMVNKVIKLIDKKIRYITLEKSKEDEEEEIVIYDKNNSKLDYDDLSTGTKKLLFLVYNSLYAIKQNAILVCDEIENSLHLDLVKLILELFTVKDSNAQLIFTTNNENVLDEEILRNDQIYCIDRDESDKIKVEKFSKMPEIRYDTVFKKNYRNKNKNIHSAQPNKDEIDKFICYIDDVKNVKEYKRYI
jgi:AAA15 family ATPase/GTPase